MCATFSQTAAAAAAAAPAPAATATAAAAAPTEAAAAAGGEDGKADDRMMWDFSIMANQGIQSDPYGSREQLTKRDVKVLIL